MPSGGNPRTVATEPSRLGGSQCGSLAVWCFLLGFVAVSVTQPTNSSTFSRVFCWVVPACNPQVSHMLRAHFNAMAPSLGISLVLDVQAVDGCEIRGFHAPRNETMGRKPWHIQGESNHFVGFLRWCDKDFAPIEGMDVSVFRGPAKIDLLSCWCPVLKPQTKGGKSPDSII